MTSDPSQKLVGSLSSRSWGEPNRHGKELKQTIPGDKCCLVAVFWARHLSWASGLHQRCGLWLPPALEGRWQWWGGLRRGPRCPGSADPSCCGSSSIVTTIHLAAS
ncbi:hypothetical protein ABBQ38_013366 [Trebouxia sp. C0009 RCD-2024]